MPPLVKIRNPLDLAGDTHRKRYGDALTNLANDPKIDILVVIVLFQTPGPTSTLAAEVIGIKALLDAYDLCRER